MSDSTLLLFAVTSLLIIISPGQDLVLIISRSIAQGAKADRSGSRLGPTLYSDHTAAVPTFRTFTQAHRPTTLLHRARCFFRIRDEVPVPGGMNQRSTL